MTVIEGSTVPTCRCEEHIRRKSAAAERDFKRDTITVGSIDKAFNQFVGRSCSNCERQLNASPRIQVDNSSVEAEC